MNDRELLELAAKAAGYKVAWEGGCETGWMAGGTWWNPITDDGDALRLAVKRRFHVCIFSASSDEGIDSPGFVEIWQEGASDPLCVQQHVEGGDYEAATRRAIVRAAAEVGRAMP